MSKKFLFVFFFFLIHSFFAICQTSLSGKVVAVADGDTFTLLVKGNKQVKVRLHGIDCPEKSQHFGKRAKEFTSQKVFGKLLHVEVKNTDRYGRKIGIVRLADGSVLNEELLAAGLAWHYKRYDKSQRYADLENRARDRKIGIWSVPGAIAP